MNCITFEFLWSILSTQMKKQVCLNIKKDKMQAIVIMDET